MQYIPFFQSNRVTMQGCGREGKRGVKWGVWVGVGVRAAKFSRNLLNQSGHFEA